MSRGGRPRVHLHLSRETIARTGLALIDRDGQRALSLRNIANELHVGPSTLYGHVRSREELECDIVALLLAEVDTSERPGERWGDGLRRVADSLRQMALRHPRAFLLVALAPVDEPPVLDYAHALSGLSVADMNNEEFLDSWQVVDAFLTGFLLMEAAAISRASQPSERPAGIAARPDSFQRGMATVHSEAAFAAALEVIIRGFRPPRESD